MRRSLLFLCLLAVLPLTAQLSVDRPASLTEELGGYAGAEPSADFIPHYLPVSLRTRVRAPYTPMLPLATPAPFDFGATKPHLAFFCRLELDIEEATRFPVRFRLGEVRSWQQEISKRD